MKPRTIFIILLSISIIDTSVYALVIPTTLKLLHMGIAKNADTNYEIITMLSPAYLLAVPVFMLCADKWGRKKILTTCLFLTVLGYTTLLLASITKSMPLVFLSIVLLDLTSSTLPVILAFVADVTCGRQRTFYFIILALVSLGDMPIIDLGRYLINNQQHLLINASIITSAALFMGLVNLVLCVKFLPNFSLTHLKQHYRNMRISLEEIVSATSYVFSVSKARFYLLAFALFQFAFCLYSRNNFSYFSKVSQSAGLHNFHTFSLYTYISTVFLLIFVYPKINLYVNDKVVLLFCIFSTIFGIFLNLSFPVDAWLPWFSSLLIYPAMTLLTPLLWAILSNETDRWHQGILMGLIYIISTFVWTISGVLADFFNEISMYFTPLITVAFLLAAIIPLLKAGKKGNQGYCV
jgi:MFS family permease